MQSRVVQCAVGERSYHIFYHLCAGAPQSLRSMLLCPKLCFSYQESFVLVTLYSYLMLSTGKMVHLLKCIILDSRIIVSYNVVSRLEKKENIVIYDWSIYGIEFYKSSHFEILECLGLFILYTARNIINTITGLD